MEPIPYLAAGGPRLRLLGRFEVSCGDRPLSIGPAGERLLAYLAVRTEPARRQEVASALWPDCTDIRATANLRSTLSRLHARSRNPLVQPRVGSIDLMPDCSIDIYDVHQRVSQSLLDDEVTIPVLRQDVLPDWPEEWLIATREWFRQVRLRALESLSDRHRAAGRFGAALDAGMAAVSCDPLRETAHRRLARVHIAEGNYAEALRQYDMYRKLARAELGIPPSPQFRKLIAPLLGRPLD